MLCYCVMPLLYSYPCVTKENVMLSCVSLQFPIISGFEGGCQVEHKRREIGEKNDAKYVHSWLVMMRGVLCE